MEKIACLHRMLDRNLHLAHVSLRPIMVHICQEEPRRLADWLLLSSSSTPIWALVIAEPRERALGEAVTKAVFEIFALKF